MLLDSNILIYFAQSGTSEREQVRAFLIDYAERRFFVSEISRVEVFGYSSLTAREETMLNQMYGTTTELPISPALDRAVVLRQRRHGLKTPDALIAATALHYALPLVTHNVRDFEWIDGLDVVDPLRLSS